VIVFIESHERARAPARPQASAPDCGARWGKASEYGFDQTDAEAENEGRGGFNTVERSSSPSRIKLWNLSPVWRAHDVVEVPSSADPAQTIEATVTRQLLVPVGSSTQKYVGGGIGYVEDPRGYGYEERTIHTYVLLTIPSPLPDAEVVDSGVEGEWPSYPTEAFSPGTYSPSAPLPGPWTR
jgi:hypothetical protein